MKLPARLETLLRQDNGLASVVLGALHVIEPWARDNKTVFFPEYTDHSLTHLNEVLASADSLISDSAWQYLTPEDAAVTVLSGLLHDSALHLTEDGFYALINGKYVPQASRYAKADTPWIALWTEYLAEARRFDQRKLQALFGDSEPVHTIPAKKLDLTLKHRLLIGEFLRRHHARLAHEIAVTGIPNEGVPIPITSGTNPELLDLAGYVARSHNLDIRSAIDGLEQSKRRIHLNCRVPFVMVVLRISDYLQIHSARAPGDLMRLKNLVSPVSRGEWYKHKSVREINQAHEDPEAIFVECDPDTAHAFIGMRNLLRDIQMELDRSWAALGEIYGRYAPLDKLGITIRRVRSNIDDAEQYRLTRQPPYIPHEFKFRTASAELMDLLVAPLYGQRPEIGIRELVQNAVDACLERDDLITRRLVEFREPFDDDVVVRLMLPTDGKPSLVIEDFGVGMTPSIVEQYFLNVGASFRSSDLWRREHEIDGHSTIHRTGRFGIGLLAAFLLGKEVRVTTRHLSNAEDAGISFVCRQGAEAIEVRPCKFHAGTKIEIELSEPVAKKLEAELGEWDWYCLGKPRVRRFVHSNKVEELSQHLTLPECDSNLDSLSWRRINAQGYDDVIWSYESFPRYNRYSNRVLVCNGIFVTDSLYQIGPGISPGLNMINADDPSLVVFDPDGRFPINLQRDEIATDILPFDRELSLDVSDFFVSKIIQKFEVIPPGLSRESVELSAYPGIPGLSERKYSQPRPALLLITRQGIIPADIDLLGDKKPSCILVDAVNLAGDRGSYGCSEIKSTNIPYLAVDGVTQTKSSRTYFLRHSLGMSNYDGTSSGFFSSLEIVGRRLFVRKQDVTQLVSPGNVPRTQWSQLQLECEVDKYGLWSIGSLPRLELDLEAIGRYLEDMESLGFTLLYFSWPEDRASEPRPRTAFSEAWQRYVEGPEFVQRRRKPLASTPLRTKKKQLD